MGIPGAGEKSCRPSDYLPLVVMVAGEAGDIPGSRLSGKTAASYDGEAAEGPECGWDS